MVFGTCLAAITVLRGRWLAAPLVAFAGRLLLEPTWFIYYGALAIAGALLWDLRQTRRVPVWTLWTLAAEYGAQHLIPWDSVAGAYVNFGWAMSVILGVLGPVLLRPRDGLR